MNDEKMNGFSILKTTEDFMERYGALALVKQYVFSEIIGKFV